MTVSVRGLSEGLFLPVLKVTGTLENVYEDPKDYKDSDTGKVTTRVQNMLILGDLKDLVTDGTPYTKDTVEISIPASNRKDSRWGIFAASATKFLAEDEDVSDLVGKRVTMEMVDHRLFDVNSKEKDRKSVTKAWELVTVEGRSGDGVVAKVDAKELALELLEGKNWGQFYSAALSRTEVQKDKGVLNAIIAKDPFVADAAKAGFAIGEDGVYRKV